MRFKRYRETQFEVSLFKKQKPDETSAKLNYISKLIKEADLKPLPDDKPAFMSIGKGAIFEEVDFQVIQELENFKL